MFWGETKVKQFTVRIVVYKTRRTMNKAIQRHYETSKTCSAFCGWSRNIVCLIFNEQDLNHELVAHEVYHAYEYFRRNKAKGFKLEESRALSLGFLTQAIYEFFERANLKIS